MGITGEDNLGVETFKSTELILYDSDNLSSVTALKVFVLRSLF